MVSQLTFINHNLRLEYTDLFGKKRDDQEDDEREDKAAAGDEESEQSVEESDENSDVGEFYVDFD